MARQMAPVFETLENRELLTTVFSEGFEGAFPGTWTSVASQGRAWGKIGYAHSGDWSCFGSYADDASATYVNNMNAYIERTIDLSAYAGRQIRLDWHNIVITEPTNDYLGVSVNGTMLSQFSGQYKKWSNGSLSLNAYAGNPNVTIRFSFISNGSVITRGNAGAVLDDIRVTAAPVAVPQIFFSCGTMVKEKHAFYGGVNAGNPARAFQFTLPYEKKFSAKLKGTGEGDADLYLYNEAGTVIATSALAGTASESISRTLPAGTYYVAIQPVAGTVDYTLSMK